MPRPPLPIGTYGNIFTYEVSAGHCAETRFRDYDGVTRKVRRVGHASHREEPAPR